ncbi:MAG: NIPSNAP family protein [Pseudomonadota bacterium]
MITTVIRYEIDPWRRAAFEEYARLWNLAAPRCGADLTGWFAPHEGSTSLAYGIYATPDLAAYEAYRARLAEDEAGREAFALAQRERFIRSETRTFLKRVEGLPEGRFG